VDQTAGRVPVYAGASEITTRDCIKLVKLAEECKVDAVSVLTPYFITPSKSELKDHYKTIAASTYLPIILYGNDERTNVGISPDMAEELADIDNIVGIKDSSGDMTKMGEYIRLTRNKDFHVIAGRDTMILANLVYGGAGAIAATANIAPAIVSGIYKAFKAGDLKKALERQYALAPLRIAFGLGTYPVVMKEALRLVGIDAGECLSPVGPISEENRVKLAELLKQMGVYHTVNY
jgi:4-hydroxy-tetrahydrodipicolinate synthase